MPSQTWIFPVSAASCWFVEAEAGTNPILQTCSTLWHLSQHICLQFSWVHQRNRCPRTVIVSRKFLEDSNIYHTLNLLHCNNFVSHRKVVIPTLIGYYIGLQLDMIRLTMLKLAQTSTKKSLFKFPESLSQFFFYCYYQDLSRLNTIVSMSTFE